MHKTNRVRNFVLLILFVMILICGVFAVSYSYYTAPDTTTRIYDQLIRTECLTLSTVSGYQRVYTTAPAYLYPISESDANMYAIPYNSTTNTGGPLGVVTFVVKNSCNKEEYVDIAMISGLWNTMNFTNIAYSYCSFSTATTCLWSYVSTHSSYCSNRRGATYYNTYVSPELKYPKGLDAYIKVNYGAGNSYCGLLGPSGALIAAGATKNITIRYWLGSDATDYVGKVFNPIFVMFTKEPNTKMNCNSGSCIIGDVNQDYVVNYADVTKLFQYVSNTTTLTANQLAVADVNFDGSIDNKDVVLLNQIALPKYYN